MATRGQYEYDGLYDWVLKKDGKQAEVNSMMKEQLELKAPLLKNTANTLR
jgi:hypothetical protein